MKTPLELIDNMWKGRRCFIVGGGPSLSDFDWSMLEGELSIGINRAVEFFDPTIVFSMDTRFYDWITRGRLGERARDLYEAHPGKVMLNTCPGKRFAPDVAVVDIKTGNKDTLSNSMADGLGHGGNSGFAALNLALNLGANPIYLLGFDMQADPHDQSRMHFHGGYPDPQGAGVYKRFGGPFVENANTAKARVRVINCNPDSGLRCFEFGDLPDDVSRRTDFQKTWPLFVSFYTEENDYEREAKELMQTLRRWRLPYLVEALPSMGSWERNTNLKPLFLNRVRAKNPNQPLVWLDADARVQERPDLFRLAGTREEADFACHMRNGTELLSGTLFFNNTAKANELLELWADAAFESPTAWDQRSLQAVLPRWEENGGRRAELPAHYCAIFDTMKPELAGHAPVIEHFQASRRIRSQA